MEKVKEKAKKYEVSILLKGNGYYLARMSLKLGGGPSQRPQSSGTTAELALSGLLDKIIQCIDTSYNQGLITFKIDDRISQRLVQSINSTGIISPEIMEKTLIIVNKINTINAHILENISIQNNIIPFYNKNVVSTTNNGSFTAISPQANIVNTTTPIIHNVNTGEQISTQKEQIIIEDLAIEWLKYRQALCKKTEDNPEPISRKTLDGNRNRLKKDILPFLKNEKKIYLSQLTENCIVSLLKNIKSQNAKHKSYVVLNLLFKYAIKEKGFSHNPMVKVDKPPEKIKTGKDDNENYIDPDRQDIWLDLFEKEHKENNNNPNHIHRDIALLFEIMLLTRITTRRSLSV